MRQKGSHVRLRYEGLPAHSSPSLNTTHSRPGRSMESLPRLHKKGRFRFAPLKRCSNRFTLRNEPLPRERSNC
ncbi:MAG: hypothetical protein ABI165_09530 [Bryobacteraceae bacterium]